MIFFISDQCLLFKVEHDDSDDDDDNDLPKAFGDSMCHEIYIFLKSDIKYRWLKMIREKKAA